jgi:hypothetical protein
MSSAQNLPNRTQILIKDLQFQEKYQLSHSQTDLMAYLANVPYWAINIDGYFVIATAKIMEDLPTMGKKTIEASLKVLRDLKLISSKIVEVKRWRGKPKLRAIQLTPNGKEYNKNLVLPNQDERVRRLEKENSELKKDKKELQDIIEKMRVAEPEPEPKEESNPIPETPPKEALELFIDDIIRRFGRTGKPLCNAVPTWNIKTTFYINSYNKLSLITPENKSLQLKDPIQINKFWNWLFNHPTRLGDKIDFSKAPTTKLLKKRFINQNINLNGAEKRVSDIVEVEGMVKLKLQNQDNTSSFVIDSKTKKDMTFTHQKCQDILFKLLL